jgi:hypothetical protein
MARWWEVNAERWEREKQAMDKAGIEFTEDEPARKKGKLVLNLMWKLGDQPLRLVAHFPTPYPFFPPMVVAPDLELARHQTPGSKQLCLLARGAEQWKPATDTLATLLQQQMPRVLRSQPGGPEEDAQGQEAEPITAYLQPIVGSFVGFPTYNFAGLPAFGTVLFGLDSLQPLRGTVVEVLDADGKRLFASEARDATYYEQHKRPVITGRWLRLNERPLVGSASDYYDIAVRASPDMQKPHWQPISSGEAKFRLDIVALLFQDELAWKKTAGNAILVSKIQQLEPRRAGIVTELNRIELESRAAYFMRDPSSDGLQKCCVTLVGAGSIGSPAAKLLAQGGVGSLRIVDHDILDAGNAIRWEIGRSAAGIPKAHVLHRTIDANYPYTHVEGANWRIGDPHLAGDPREPELYDQLFRGVDCVFDASASLAVNHFLSEWARFHRVPYVWMHATPGAWGGLVGRSGIEKSDFCWMCHLLYLNPSREGEIKIDPLSSAPEEDRVQPPGCLDPTFIGSQVDLTEVSLMGTRLVIDQALTRTGVQAQSSYDWNIATLRLRDPAGRPQLPSWQSYVLPRHADCPNH